MRSVFLDNRAAGPQVQRDSGTGSEWEEVQGDIGTTRGGAGDTGSTRGGAGDTGSMRLIPESPGEVTVAQFPGKFPGSLVVWKQGIF